MEKVLKEISSTPQEMKDFAARFNKTEWNQLVECQQFVDVLPESIAGARILAEKILAGKYNGKKIDWRNNPYARK